MLELDNIIYFDNDNDFFAFSVKPEIMICDSKISTSTSSKNDNN